MCVQHDALAKDVSYIYIRTANHARPWTEASRATLRIFVGCFGLAHQADTAKAEPPVQTLSRAKDEMGRGRRSVPLETRDIDALARMSPFCLRRAAAAAAAAVVVSRRTTDGGKGGLGLGLGGGVRFHQPRQSYSHQPRGRMGSECFLRLPQGSVPFLVGEARGEKSLDRLVVMCYEAEAKREREMERWRDGETERQRRRDTETQGEAKVFLGADVCDAPPGLVALLF